MRHSRAFYPISLRPSPLSCALLLAFATPLTGAAFAQGSLVDLGKLNGGTFSQASGVSANGSVVVGTADDGALGNARRAFLWTASGGMVSLGTLNGGTASQAAAVSADGSVVVGGVTDGSVGNLYRAFRWTSGGGLVSLGSLNGGFYSQASGVSADGSVVVGYSADGAVGNATRAFRWTQSGGMVSLGVLNGGTTSYAYGVSADGSVVVGTANDGAAGNLPRAFRWTQSDGMTSLGALYGGVSSFALGVSADGKVIVGTASDGDAGNADRAFRWTQAGGMVSLGALNGGALSNANAVNADGKVVVGWATDGAAANASRAFRWTQATGMQSVENWLRSTGVTVAQDITSRATGVNQDGSVVVGNTQNNTAFIARASSGLITLPDVARSLAGTTQGAGMALSATGVLLNGAHSRPLMRRVAEDKNTFWLAGDWGRDDHGARDGDFGLAELGLGRNFGPVQLNVSLGQTWAKQKQVQNGRTQADGTYLLVEALLPVHGDLWAVLGGYGHWGSAEVRRGYLNAGFQDYSSGRPDTDTWGLRGRLEWDRAWRLGRAEFSPYADLSYSESKLAAYTETGGGFPARFDARTDTATELRLGINAAKPLDNGLTLTGVFEAAHRFEKNGAATSGQMLGLFAFNLPGKDNQQDWLRVGAGLEGNLASGKGSLFLNLTTRGETPSAWLAAAWQKAF
ncbi:autotransporter domain-containing protein [Oryzomicrobium sp.]|uniref:autotransporter domain-containing protein n=1 Tax=Oryzomicrobium sp. TaxID=1911578 RepID=UPI002FDF93FD